MQQKFRAILVFGPPGCGKGTLSKFLSTAGNHFHLSSGDIFRGLDPDSSMGQLYHSYASQGNLVPDSVTIDVWYHYVQGLIATNRYFPKKQFLLLDGIPRTIEQAKIVEKYIEVRKVIVLQIRDPEVVIKRMQRRALIEKRQDDADEKVLRHRIAVYEQQTKALLEYYPTESLAVFDAELTPLEILRDVLISLSSILSHPER